MGAAIQHADAKMIDTDCHLLDAVIAGDISRLYRLLDLGADVNCVAEDGRTALHLAADIGNADICRLLIHYGADINAQTYTGFTPLFFASRRNLQAVQVLIGSGCDVTLCNYNDDTALHAASASGRHDVIAELIASGCDVSAENCVGYTPLFLAIQSGSGNAVHTLIQLGADPNASHTGPRWHKYSKERRLKYSTSDVREHLPRKACPQQEGGRAGSNHYCHSQERQSEHAKHNSDGRGEPESQLARQPEGQVAYCHHRRCLHQRLHRQRQQRQHPAGSQHPRVLRVRQHSTDDYQHGWRVSCSDSAPHLHHLDQCQQVSQCDHQQQTHWCQQDRQERFVFDYQQVPYLDNEEVTSFHLSRSVSHLPHEHSSHSSDHVQSDSFHQQAQQLISPNHTQQHRRENLVDYNCNHQTPNDDCPTDLLNLCRDTCSHLCGRALLSFKPNQQIVLENNYADSECLLHQDFAGRHRECSSRGQKELPDFQYRQADSNACCQRHGFPGHHYPAASVDRKDLRSSECVHADSKNPTLHTDLRDHRHQSVSSFDQAEQPETEYCPKDSKAMHQQSEVPDSQQQAVSQNKFSAGKKAGDSRTNGKKKISNSSSFIDADLDPFSPGAPATQLRGGRSRAKRVKVDDFEPTTETPRNSAHDSEHPVLPTKAHCGREQIRHFREERFLQLIHSERMDNVGPVYSERGPSVSSECRISSFMSIDGSQTDSEVKFQPPSGFIHLSRNTFSDSAGFDDDVRLDVALECTRISKGSSAERALLRNLRSIRSNSASVEEPIGDSLNENNSVSEESSSTVSQEFAESIEFSDSPSDGLCEHATKDLGKNSDSRDSGDSHGEKGKDLPSTEGTRNEEDSFSQMDDTYLLSGDRSSRQDQIPSFDLSEEGSKEGIRSSENSVPRFETFVAFSPTAPSTQLSEGRSGVTYGRCSVLSAQRCNATSIGMQITRLLPPPEIEKESNTDAEQTCIPKAPELPVFWRTRSVLSRVSEESSSMDSSTRLLQVDLEQKTSVHDQTIKDKVSELTLSESEGLLQKCSSEERSSVDNTTLQHPEDIEKESRTQDQTYKEETPEPHESNKEAGERSKEEERKSSESRTLTHPTHVGKKSSVQGQTNKDSLYSSSSLEGDLMLSQSSEDGRNTEKSGVLLDQAETETMPREEDQADQWKSSGSLTNCLQQTETESREQGKTDQGKSRGSLTDSTQHTTLPSGEKGQADQGESRDLPTVCTQHTTLPFRREGRVLDADSEDQTFDTDSLAFFLSEDDTSSLDSITLDLLISEDYEADSTGGTFRLANESKVQDQTAYGGQYEAPSSEKQSGRQSLVSEEEAISKESMATIHQLSMKKEANVQGQTTRTKRSISSRRAHNTLSLQSEETSSADDGTSHHGSQDYALFSEDDHQLSQLSSTGDTSGTESSADAKQAYKSATYLSGKYDTILSSLKHVEELGSTEGVNPLCQGDFHTKAKGNTETPSQEPTESNLSSLSSERDSMSARGFHTHNVDFVEGTDQHPWPTVLEETDAACQAGREKLLLSAASSKDDRLPRAQSFEMTSYVRGRQLLHRLHTEKGRTRSSLCPKVPETYVTRKVDSLQIGPEKEFRRETQTRGRKADALYRSIENRISYIKGQRETTESVDIPLHMPHPQKEHEEEIESILCDSSRCQKKKELGARHPFEMKDSTTGKVLLYEPTEEEEKRRERGLTVKSEAPVFRSDRERLSYALHCYKQPGGFRGITPLHKVAEPGMESVAAALLNTGHVDVNAKTETGETPLHFAAFYSSISGQGEVTGLMRLLISAGADVNAATLTGDTPLHFAALVGDPLSTSVLISAGADVRAEDVMGNVPLHKACKSLIVPESNKARTTRLLLHEKADPNVRNEEGLTPLGVVLENRETVVNTDILCELLAGGADPNMANADSVFPLMYALKHGKLEFARVLLEKGADPNIFDIEGQTPFHRVCKHGDIKLFRSLLAKGGDPTKPDKRGFTPLRCAVGADAQARTNTSPPSPGTGEGGEAMVRALILSGVSTFQRELSARAGIISDKLSKWAVLTNGGTLYTTPPPETPFCAAFCKGDATLMKILLESGSVSLKELHHVRLFLDLNTRTLNEKLKDGVSLVREATKEPPSLQNFCRWTVSHSIGWSAKRKSRVRSLGLSQLIRSFILFEDLFHNF